MTSLPLIHIRWSAPIPMEGADASPIPPRGGVYEIMVEDDTGVERIYAGETGDLRRTFVSHSGGSKGDEELRRAILQNCTFFRYWECEVMSRRLEVVAALLDTHIYEYGTDNCDGAGCVRIQETY